MEFTGILFNKVFDSFPQVNPKVDLDESGAGRLSRRLKRICKKKHLMGQKIRNYAGEAYLRGHYPE